MINYQPVDTPNGRYVACLPGQHPLTSEQDALDLVGACAEHETDRLLLQEGSLSPDFYDLRSGLAGSVMLKFSNYRIRAAAVVPAEIASAGRFGEMVSETNRGSQFRIYATLTEAEAWLLNGPQK